MSRSSTPARASSSFRSASSAPSTAARARADALARHGRHAAKVEPRQQTFAQTMLVVRDPQQPVVARLKDLQPQYPGSELKIGACPSARADPPTRQASAADVARRARCSRSTRRGSTSICASRASRRSSRRCPARTRRRAAACCSPVRRHAPIGCIALRPLARGRWRDRNGEVKRLYVRPPRAARDSAQRSREALLREARAIGYREAQARHAGVDDRRAARCTRARVSRMRRRTITTRCAAPST